MFRDSTLPLPLLLSTAVFDGPRELTPQHHPDLRVRGNTVETSVVAAAAAVSAIEAELARLPPSAMERELVVAHKVSADGTEAHVPSSVGRELLFVAHHGE